MLRGSPDIKYTFYVKMSGQAFDEDNITSSWPKKSEKTTVPTGPLVANQSHCMPYDGKYGNEFSERFCVLVSNPSHSVAKSGIANEHCGKSDRAMGGFA